MRPLICFTLVLIVSCGGRVRTDDTSGGQGGAAPTTGSATTGNAGMGNRGGSTGGPCGPIVCGPGTVCCNADCGVCIEPGGSCPAIGCTTVTTGPVTTGAGGASTTSGSGGATTTGGTGGGTCGTFDECAMSYFGICRAGAGCPCANCPCQAHACFADPGCTAIYACVAQTGCTTPSDCLQTCGAVINGNSKSLAAAVAFLTCSQSTGCGFPCEGRGVDAGGACGVPAPLGGVTCTGFGSSTGQCGQNCTDSRMNEYDSKCELVTRTCECFYNGQRVCSCTASNTQMCADCCPRWTP